MLCALSAWSAVFVVFPTVAGDPVTPLHRGEAALALVGAGATLSAAVLLWLRRRESDAEREGESRLPVKAPISEPS